MASATPEYRQGDNWPPITGTITDGSGDAVDISGADGLTFASLSTDGTAVSGVATNLDDGTEPNMGKWSYSWADNDLDVPGSYAVLIAVEWDSGETESFPSNAKNQPTYLVTANNDAPDSALEAPAPQRRPVRMTA